MHLCLTTGETATRRLSHAIALFAAVSAFALPGTARAGDENQEGDDTQTAGEDEPIRVTTRAAADESVDDERFPSGFVTRISLDDRPAGTDMSDVLAGVAGIRMRRASSFGQPSFASVRGGNPRQVSVSLNDMRISVPSGYGFDVGQLALSGIDSVDVHRGSAATVYGGGALTGALNMQTEPPGDEGWTASAGTMGGSFGTFGLLGSTAFASEDASVQIDANWRRSDGDFAYVDAQGNEHRRINNDHRHLALLASGRFDLGDHRLEPTLMVDGGTSGLAGPGEFQGAFDDARLETMRTIGQIRWSSKSVHTGDFGAMDAHASMGYQQRHSDYTNDNSFPGGGSVRDQTRHHGISLQGGVDTWFSFGDMLRSSVEIRREAYDSTHREARAEAELGVERYTVAPSISNELLAFDHALSLVTSARAEVIEERVLGQRTLALGDLDGRSWAQIIPAAGLSWRANSDLTLKTNVARTSRAPDFDELYLDIVGMRGSPDLEPERATNIDAGVRVGDDESAVSGELVGFYNDIDEMIHFVATTAYLFEARNLGSGTSFGAEATARWRPWERLALSGSYTWNESSLDGLGGTLIPGQPRHRARADVRINLESLAWLGSLPELTLRSSANWRSPINLDPFGNLRSDAYWTLDAGAQLHPLEWFDLGVNVRNITDNRGGADSLQRPLPGRAVYITASATAGSL